MLVNKKKRSSGKAWVVAADMGYGHQRAAYPLKDIAYDRIINANSDKIVTKREKKEWRKFLRYYEGVSQFRAVPIIGPMVWKLYDHFQKISPYYPFRDLSKPTLASIYMHRLIRKGFLNNVTDYARRENIPFISTFFATAMAAAHNKIKDVYCVVTDTDINRIWVPEDPKKEKLYYLTPTEHSSKRLMEYGISEDEILFTGFPLPKENTGKNMSIATKDLGNRLANLDPKGVFITRYRDTLKRFLGKNLKSRSNHPLTITFVIGGAGAQREIGAKLLKSLKKKILNHEIRLNIIAGIRLELAKYFADMADEQGLGKEIGRHVNILSELDKKSYFKSFNEVLHTTDILWTKPSELSFYTALGLPIIIAPPIGAHEELNAKWLVRMGSGLRQEDPAFADEWLFEWLNKGIIAEAAWEGFTEAPRYGTYNIEKVVFSKDKKSVKFKY
ncbi:hypothetical protein HQ545_06110 [Candidatus Woesearchaeota archaeon]|nr:hypothetical protein [Candidatus Woesearchaeota archaeon]